MLILGIGVTTLLSPLLTRGPLQQLAKRVQTTPGMQIEFRAEAKGPVYRIVDQPTVAEVLAFLAESCGDKSSAQPISAAADSLVLIWPDQTRTQLLVAATASGQRRLVALDGLARESPDELWQTLRQRLARTPCYPVFDGEAIYYINAISAPDALRKLLDQANHFEAAGKPGLTDRALQLAGSLDAGENPARAETFHKLMSARQAGQSLEEIKLLQSTGNYEEARR
jgi:hypothetical protein